jgi:hypothetical protein
MGSPRAVAVVALVAALGGCAHGRWEASERLDEGEAATATATSTSTPTSTSTSTSTPTPTSTSISTSTSTASQVTVKRWRSSPVRGAFAGAGVVLGLFGRFCIAGKAITIILCAYAVVEGWPYLVAATVFGAGIGAAVSSSSSGQLQPGRPHDETASAPRVEEPVALLAPGGT